METKVLLTKDFCEIEAIKYVASRYGTTPEKVLMHYFVQTGIVQSREIDDDYELQPNELALLHDLGVDLGVQPEGIELK